MTELPIPDGAANLGRAWLQDALEPHLSGRLASIDLEPLGEGVGILGELSRVSLQYEDGAAGPASLIAKFPSRVAVNRDLAHGAGYYATELGFYQHASASAPIRVATPYYTDIDSESGDFVLLLEDLGAGEVGDQVAGSDEERSRRAILEIAKVHVDWWDRVDTDAPWLRSFDSPAFVAFIYEVIPAMWPVSLPHFEARVGAAATAAAERLLKVLPPLMTEISRPPRTLVHGDFRLDNLVFGLPGEGDAVAVLDWQIAGKGRGAYDVGYHLSQSIAPSVREEIEERLVHDYHDALVNGGVGGYSFDDCWTDYRRAVMFCLVYPIAVFGGVDLGNERGLALAEALLERSAAAVEGLVAWELLPD